MADPGPDLPAADMTSRSGCWS